MRGLTSEEIDVMSRSNDGGYVTVLEERQWQALHARGLIDRRDCRCDGTAHWSCYPTPLGLLLLALHKSGEVGRAA